jgi:hypothetical protein
LAVLLLNLMAVSCFGHGRNSTAVRIDLEADAAQVVIEAVVIDLLQVAGVTLRQWRDLSVGQRSAVLTTSAERMAGRFHLYQQAARLEVAGQPTVQLPDWQAAAGRYRGLDQQTATISLQYRFATPPGSLTFWQTFDGGPVAEPIYSQLTVWRSGEMVLLPAELGPGLLVSLPLDWERPPQPLARQRSLAAAACRWINRPANARLEHGESSSRLTVHLPLAAVHAARRAAGMATDWPAVRRDLGQAMASGVGHESAAIESTIRLYPLSAHALIHDRQHAPDKPEDVLVELEWMVPHAPGTDLVSSVPTINLQALTRIAPLIYTEVVIAAESRALLVVTPQSPAIDWPLITHSP